jgi:hypothetical protein
MIYAAKNPARQRLILLALNAVIYAVVAAIYITALP